MGKRTTTRHKEDNTFKFQKFEEKLRQISVNVNLSIRDGRGERPDDDETYFSQEIEKWVDLNRTETFADLLCQIGTDCRTLTQLLFKKDKIAEILLSHLDNTDNLASFEPAFALTIAISRDLGEEFYPHFENFFNTIIKIVMEAKSTNIIEAGFKCYAYLSKYLRKQIVKDLSKHMKMFSCFLDPKLKTYVIIFACEAFAIVAGKFARDHTDKFLKLVYAIFLKKHPEHSIGVSTLLFTIFKGIGSSVKLEGPGMLFKDCVNFLYTLEKDTEQKVWSEMLCELTRRLINHANAANSATLIQLFGNIIVENLAANQPVTNLVTVLLTMAEFNNCGKLTNLPDCAKVLHKICETDLESNMEILAQFVIIVIESKCSSSDSEILSLFQPVINSLLAVVPYHILENLDKCLRGFRVYFRMFLESIIEAYNRVDKPTQIAQCPNLTVYCLSEALIKQGGLYHLSNADEHYLTGNIAPMFYFNNQKRIFATLNASNLRGTLWNCCSFLTEMNNEITTEEISESKLNYYVRLLLVFSRLNIKNCETCLNTCVQLLRKTVESGQFKQLLPSVYYILQVVTAQMSSQVCENLPVQELLAKLGPLVSSDNLDPWSIKVLDILVTFIKSSKIEEHFLAAKEFIQHNWEALTGQLKSGFRIVRALTLSILRTTVDDTSSEKMVEMLEKFLQLEDMAITNSKFSSLAKGVLTECKVIIGSELYDVNLKMLCLKYTLGLMYTNYSLIWTPCVEVIRQAGKQLEISKFWEVFGSHFCKHQTVRENTPPLTTSFLPTDENDFMELTTLHNFGLPQTAAGYDGPQEQLDITQYKINLWTSLKGIPLTKNEYSDIRSHVEYIIEKPVEINDEDMNSYKREKFKVLVPVLQFLETCDIVNVNHELWESALVYLTYAHDVQKAAWKFLFAKRKGKLKNYKEDLDEILNSESMDPVHKFRIDAVDVSLNKQYENETVERRSVLMDILIRILIGKERTMKGEKRTQVLRFLAGCLEADARKYLDLTVGSHEDVQQLPPKIIEIKINKMTSALRIWRYKFPSILDEIAHKVCDLVCAVSSSVKPFSRKSLDPSEQIPEDVYEEQKKAALKAGRLCMIAYFTSLPRLIMKSETIDRIFEVFIWPSLNDLTTTSVGSVSWIMKLFLVWSTHERYHPLMTKCKDGDVQQSPMWGLFDLLDTKSAVFEVKKYILGIIMNLTNPPEVDEDLEEGNEEYLSCSNAPLNVSGLYTFETSESIGVNVVLLRKDVILNLLQDAQTFKRFTSQPGGGGCLELVALLAGFSAGGVANEKLCSVIMDTFAMLKNNEEKLFNSIDAVGKLLKCLDNPSDLLMKLAPNFSWINGRRLRTVLVEALACTQDSELYTLISGMNAWADLATDTPNFGKRQKAFEDAKRILASDKFDALTYTILFYNCIYNVRNDEDIGMRNTSKNLLLVMASSLKNKTETVKNDEVHKLLDSVILPKLRAGVHLKDDKRYEDIMKIIQAFIDKCSQLHGTFKDLAKILSADITSGLSDIQVHMRTRAMNKLCKKLNEVIESVSPAVIQAFILPIATHNLFDEDRLGKNYNELIDASVEVLKTIMGAASQDHYFSYLNKLLDDPKKHTRLAKQYERVLIAVMDAFHFDLSLACPTETKADVQPIPAVKDQTEPPVSTNGKSSEGKDSEDEEDDPSMEEFNIPSQLVMKTTLVPQPAAVKCLGVLKTAIIPKLRKFLHFEETATHKLSRSKKSVDDDVILKIPCTIALVKLLKRIPKAEGQNGIRSIIPSLTAGLRNPLVSVRNTLRKTLLNVIKELGTSHIKVVVGYLKSSLQRGYQKHVLNYTVAYILRCLEPQLKTNTHHVPIKEIISLCEDELYGVMQEEKELAAIKQKTREASKSNACPILKVCSKCVSTLPQLNNLIEPAVKHIAEKKSIKVSKASRMWLNSVSEGLADNNAINCHELLNWLYDVANKDNAAIEAQNKQSDEPPSKKSKLLEIPKDCKLIPTVKRKSVSEGKVAAHSLLAEFAFTCLYSGLNKNGKTREKISNKDSFGILDKFLPNLTDGIKSTSKQVNVVALRCLTYLMEFDLTGFKKSQIINGMQHNGFIAMSNHCYRNTTDSEMTNATFKFLTAFFVRFPDFKVTLQDFELMLKCIQSYLTDGNCSSSAITLLKGVLQNKYRSSILQELMQEVFKQCITSYYQHINEGCRQAYLTYLNNYLTNPKDLYVEVQLILRQLDYQHESGRVTASEILNSLLQIMPEDCLEEVKELIFLKVLAVLDKEKFPKVRERLGDIMKSLFKLEKGKSLVRILLKLLTLEKHVPELDTFFLIIGLIIDDPKVFNNDDLTIIIKRIKEILEPTSLNALCSKNLDITQQIKDYMIFQAVVALKKALGRTINNLPLWSIKSPISAEMQEIFYLLRDTYLLYDHEWVPLISVDILSIVINKLQLTEHEVKATLARRMENGKETCAILQNTEHLQKLLKQLWMAMRKSDREDMMAKGAFALVQLISLAAHLNEKELFVESISCIRKSVNGEVVKTPGVFTIRTIAIGCFRGVAKSCPKEAMEEVVEIMTRVAVRELTDSNVPNDLKNETEKLVTVIRDVIGDSEFNVIHAKVNDFYHKRRNLHRAKKKETVILHPGLVRKRSKKVKPPFPMKKRKI